jgi:hypothetical protein
MTIAVYSLVLDLGFFLEDLVRSYSPYPSAGASVQVIGQLASNALATDIQ